MLEEMATVGDESIVSWQPHGKAFRVHLPDAFASTVMKRYFKQTKYKSFLRQLHIYGFRRIGKGTDRGAYYHSMFIRNKKSMSLLMSCQKLKGEAANHYAAGDQDFYSSEKPAALVNCDLLFNQEVSEGGPFQSHQVIDSSEIGLLVDWMEQARAQTILSKDEQGLASPYLGHASPAPEKCHDVSALLHDWWDDQKHGRDEGLFEGKSFYVVEQ